MTSAFSCEAMADDERCPPIAVCIKAESGDKRAGLTLPEDTNSPVDWATSGSYDRVHFLSYLRCWLQPWTEARAESKDYRLLFVDVAACHLGPEIEAYCWSCGYVLVFHYGGTTSVMQVPDTHVHQPLSKLLLELEQAQFTQRQENNPGDAGRTLQEVIDDIITVWHALDHRKHVKCHWETGVANTLDGT